MNVGINSSIFILFYISHSFSLLKVDPVKINDIRDFFKEPSSLANKLVEVEKGKDGVFEVFVLQATQSSVPLLTVPTAPAIVTASISSSDIKSSENMPEIPSSATSYTIEYKVNSSRGQNHYLVKATVVGRRLLVATVQTKDEDYSTLTSEAIQTLDSLMVTNPSNIKK